MTSMMETDNPQPPARHPGRHATGSVSLSIIIPILNEVTELTGLLAHLLPFQRQGCEILLVDGGSQDASVVLAECAGFRVLASPKGRARQMNVGASAARGEILLFLHADTRLPANASNIIQEALAGTEAGWGRFDVDISGPAALLRMVAFMMNRRSRLSGIATGDQAIFMHRALFDLVGGFPDQPLMEDIEISKRLKRYARPACIKTPVVTSGRRWLERGIWQTIFLMWRLRWAYWRGVSASHLAGLYR